MGSVGVRGTLMYLALPPDEDVVDERKCLALRRPTLHNIRDARQLEPEPEPEREPEPEQQPQAQPELEQQQQQPVAPKQQPEPEELLLLRSCGFQLFREIPPPPEAETSAAMMAYKHSIEEFVRVELQRPGNFQLSAQERVSHVIAYNHAARCSDTRCGIVLFASFYTETPNICQDRLGTTIQKL
jgi:hypothetical protein